MVRQILFEPDWRTDNQYGCPALAPDGQTLAIRVVQWSQSQLHWYANWFARLGITLNVDNSGVMLYDITSGEELTYFRDADCAAFTNDGKTLAVAGKGRVEMWDFPLRAPWHIWFLVAGALATLTFAAAIGWQHMRRVIKPAETAQLISPTPTPCP